MISMFVMTVVDGFITITSLVVNPGHGVPT